MLDGGWWPRSNDPAAELPALISGVTAHVGGIARVSLNPTAWESTPDQLQVDGRRVLVGWFRVLDAGMVSLTSASGHRIDLLVVPPGATAMSAAAAMATAADRENRARPAAILATSDITNPR